MKLSNIKLDEFGQVTCTDSNGNEIFLQLPLSPDSQNTINDEQLDNDTAREYQAIIDKHFGGDDRTLARLCYAGGQVYKSYTEKDGVYTTDDGDEFVESRYADIYNIEAYERKSIDYDYDF